MKNLFSISTSCFLLLASLLLTAPSAHAGGGGCGEGGAGWMCGEGSQRTYWNDKDYEYASSLPGAIGTQSSSMFPNFYRAGDWITENIITPTVRAAFSRPVQRHFWTPLSQGPMDLDPRIPWIDNLAAMGMISLGRWGRAMKGIGSSAQALDKIGEGMARIHVPSSVDLTLGPSSRLNQALEGKWIPSGRSLYGKITLPKVAAPAAPIVKPSSVVITRASREFNQLYMFNELPQVAVRESIGGNAGAGRLAVNAWVDAETGTLRAIGNSQDIRVTLEGAREVTFLMHAETQITSEGARWTSGFDKLLRGEGLDPAIRFHLEELATELFPVQTKFFKR